MPPKTVLTSRTTTSLSWRECLHWFRSAWKQGEHITAIGPTGVGKTETLMRIVNRRDYVTTFATKGHDKTMDKMVRSGYTLQRDRWNGAYDDFIVLWPVGKSRAEVEAKQYHVFTEAIDSMYMQKGWCMFFDEVSYMTDFLGMQRTFRWLLQQGRSSGISVVAATQRPAFIPLAFYDMPEWLIFWNDNDETNLKRIAGIGGVNGRDLRKEVMSLGHREILIVHNRHPYERVRSYVKI